MTVGTPPLIDLFEGPVNIDSMDSLLADLKCWLCTHNWIDADSVITNAWVKHVCSKALVATGQNTVP